MNHRYRYMDKQILTLIFLLGLIKLLFGANQVVHNIVVNNVTSTNSDSITDQETNHVTVTDESDPIPSSPSTSKPTLNNKPKKINTEENEDLKYPLGGFEEVEILPERPLQLLRPDAVGHKKLELVEENVRHLHYMKGGVAVVAVVGKFHSGKSFLLNQLMGKDDGFGIGPTVRPHTMGIWMWGNPQIVKTSNGETLSVIYLDTEGFAASNISEIYDAKIFAVATILSSYLIFNSVKIIDQADIDYLDLLSRRTRLFALKSQITKSKWFDEFNHDLLQFPPLLWVVQDFVQSTEDGETPQEWLHRIMGSFSRESDDHSINLLGMFQSVNCHTLFLPATQKRFLQDLSLAKDEDLTSEYREEREELQEIIKMNLKPKEKNGKPITGPELATLLGILVDAANEGSLAEIPSRWNAFLEHLHISSVEDCILFYESEMTKILRKYNQGAINATELKMWHEQSIQNAKDLLEKLLLGLQNATLKAQEKLKKSTEEKYEKVKDINGKKIELRCGEVQRKTELKVEEALEELVYPMKGDELNSILKGIKDKYIQHYRNEVYFLSDHSSFERHLKQLQVGIDRIFNGARLKNVESMEKILKSAIDKAVVIFKKEAHNTNQIPRTTNNIKEIIISAEKTAKKVFETESEMAHDEDIYTVYLGHYKSTLQEQAYSATEENMQLIKSSCQLKSNEILSTFRENTDPKKLLFPVNETYLDERLKAERDGVFRTYSETQKSFSDTSAYIEIREQLAVSVRKVCDERRDQNYQAYIKEVETPLNIAKRLIKLSADKYDTAYSFQQYMEQVCLLHLDEGKPKHWPASLKRSIVTRYINSQKDLKDLLESKRGWWASIKGFFQWFYGLLDILFSDE